MPYGYAFAKVYDKFTENTGVGERTRYLYSLLSRFGVSHGILLDLACGTGAVSEAFIQLGYDVISVDLSYDMLMQARQRLAAYGGKALILAQDMRELDLFGTINACVCCLDSINHLTDPADVQRVFDRVSLFTEPGGVFLFDVNTVYKHEEILGSNTFVYEDESDFLVWQNEYDPADHTVQMLIDIFSSDGAGKYTRECDEVTERAYPSEALEKMLFTAGFSEVFRFGDLSYNEPGNEEQRIYFAAVK